ncbi:MAG TPA: type IV pilus biogenesis/stability protein PilW [Gammaproteobacteria bacterium]|nr:type IV pilus biogenesis/stability protein PilW [Gammaproteobacteria bacterium]
MKTFRTACLGVALAAVTACVTSGGSVSEPASENEAAIANMNLGAGYLRQGNTELAIERLQRALLQDPRLVQAHTTIGLAYNQIGNFEEAENHFLRATQLDPDDGAAANAYAVYLCERGNRWADARPFFRRAAADTDYGTPEVALTNAGLCARDAGDLAAAEENFRAALMRDARHADALLNMLELTSQRGDNLQARAFIQRYLDVRPATAPVLLTCVNVERALNNTAGADRCAAQLRSGFPGSPELSQLEAQQRRDGR